jgi:malonyl-CoA O-methyltransferase
MINSESPQHQLNKQLIRKSFERASTRYDDVAVLQRAVGDNILERLTLIKTNPETILDVGSGTGYCIDALEKNYKRARVILLDIAPGMLHQARGKQSWLAKTLRSKRSYVCGDAEALPLQDKSVDMIFSNLTIQWCEDLQHTFSEFKRVLKPEGLLMFSTLGPDTLKELRSSWYSADNDTHVHFFPDMHDVGDALLNVGFADPVMDVENYTLTYPDVYKLMHELKILGAHNVANGRSHGLTGRQKLKKVEAAYESFRQDGALPASYEVVFGHAWSPGQVNSPSSTNINVQLTAR